MKIVVLASGRGTNFYAIAKAAEEGKLAKAKVVGLITNNPQAKALDRARELQVPAFVVYSKSFRKDKKFDRDAYEKALTKVMSTLEPDLICLAGYMLILSPDFIERFANKIINIHPSLLPKYRGLNAQAQALQAGEKSTGCTVHWVTEELDAGPIILQEEIEVKDEDTEETLAARLLEIENQTYVEALSKVLAENKIGCGSKQ